MFKIGLEKKIETDPDFSQQKAPNGSGGTQHGL